MATALTSQQSKALLYLQDAAPAVLSPGTLAELLETTPEGAAATASSLVRRGLAERVRFGRVFYRAVA